MRRLIRSAFATALFCAVTSGASALPLGVNLIVNADAEAGAGDGVGDQIIRPIPGWTPQSIFSVLRYDATGFPFLNNFGTVVFAGNFPNAGSPGSQNRGNNMFFGGGERAASSAGQFIDLSDLASTIDGGRAMFDLSGWLGGYQDNADNAQLLARFLDAGGALLGQAALDGPTPAERNNVTGLFLRELDGSLPVGTRGVDIVLNMNYLRGRTNDGYADNLYFGVLAVPEPGSIALLLAAALAAGGARRTKR